MNELVAAGKRSYDLAAFVASLGDAPSTDDPKILKPKSRDRRPGRSDRCLPQGSSVGRREPVLRARGSGYRRVEDDVRPHVGCHLL